MRVMRATVRDSRIKHELRTIANRLENYQLEILLRYARQLETAYSKQGERQEKSRPNTNSFIGANHYAAKL